MRRDEEREDHERVILENLDWRNDNADSKGSDRCCISALIANLMSIVEFC